MSAGLYNHTTRGVGTVLTAAIYNADHQNHITNHNPSMIGGYSDDVAQMQIKTNPGGLGSEVLSASVADELERLRFCIARIQGTTHWYEAAVTSLATIGGGTPLTLAFAAVPLLLRRTENNTSELTIQQFGAGSGVGNQYSKRIVGTGANAVAEMREYLGSTEVKRLTGSLITHQLATHFNLAATFGAAGVGLISINPAGYMDIKMMSAPATPAADHLRLYAKDVSGKAKLAYKDEDGVETVATATDISNLQTKSRFFDSINSQSSTYTFALTDIYKLVEQTGGSTQALVIPPNSSVAFPIGTRLYFRFTSSTNTGGVDRGSGVTLHSPAGNSVTNIDIPGPGAVVAVGVRPCYHTLISSITKIDTNTWVWDSRLNSQGGSPGDGGGDGG